MFDASAVLALLFGEPGAEQVKSFLPGGVIGAANLVEVLTKLIDRGLPWHAAEQAVDSLGLQLIAMNGVQARYAAELREATRAAGLSLGDRACLALAAELERPALTADRGWAVIAAAVKVPIHFIR